MGSASDTIKGLGGEFVMRYGHLRVIFNGLGRVQKEAAELNEKFDIAAFLDAYSPGWRKEIRNKWGWWSKC